MLISIKSKIQIITLTGEATSLKLLFFNSFLPLDLKKIIIQFLLLLSIICLCHFSLMRMSWLLYLYKFIK